MFLAALQLTNQGNLDLVASGSVDGGERQLHPYPSPNPYPLTPYPLSATPYSLLSPSPTPTSTPTRTPTPTSLPLPKVTCSSRSSCSTAIAGSTSPPRRHSSCSSEPSAGYYHPSPVEPFAGYHPPNPAPRRGAGRVWLWPRGVCGCGRGARVAVAAGRVCGCGRSTAPHPGQCVGAVWGRALRWRWERGAVGQVWGSVGQRVRGAVTRYCPLGAAVRGGAGLWRLGVGARGQVGDDVGAGVQQGASGGRGGGCRVGRGGPAVCSMLQNAGYKGRL